MKQTTVCYLLRGEPKPMVLMGYKKIGFGTGKFSGIGGKVEAGETVEQAAIREVKEEICVSIHARDLCFMGRVTFLFPAKVDWNQEVSIFTAQSWQGEPEESAEMRPAWFEIARIPFDLMWSDARYWIPPVLNGIRIDARIAFNDDCETIAWVSGLPA
jgi:8-oxo-dGTP diphosphatase